MCVVIDEDDGIVLVQFVGVVRISSTVLDDPVVPPLRDGKAGGEGEDGCVGAAQRKLAAAADEEESAMVEVVV